MEDSCIPATGGDGVVADTLETGLSFPDCVSLNYRINFFFFFGHWRIGMPLLDSVLCCNMHTKMDLRVERVLE